MTNTHEPIAEVLERINELLDLERTYLRTAHRAHRAALEAQFFDDENEVHTRLEEAHAATYAAGICADEVADLLNGATDSAAVNGSQQTEGGAEQ